jgi:hypothetical protein
MFGRKPKIPIDLIFPNENLINRELILKKYTLINEQGEIDVLADPTDTFNKNIPKIATEYLSELKKSMNDSFEIVARNRYTRMEKAKLDHDRSIKKFEYKLGYLVLTDHPELKKGLSSGIAHKYYGPFEIVGKNPNNIDYFIKKCGSRKARIKQVHISRLKTFYYNPSELNRFKTEPNEINTQPKETVVAQKGSKRPVGRAKKQITNRKALVSDTEVADPTHEPREAGSQKPFSSFTASSTVSSDSESNTSDYETLAVIKNKLKNLATQRASDSKLKNNNTRINISNQNKYFAISETGLDSSELDEPETAEKLKKKTNSNNKKKTTVQSESDDPTFNPPTTVDVANKTRNLRPRRKKLKLNGSQAKLKPL